MFLKKLIRNGFRAARALLLTASGFVHAQVPISGLPPANLPLQGTDKIIVNQTVSGQNATRAAPVSAFTSLVPPLSASFILQSPNALIPNSRTLQGTANEILLGDGGPLGNLVLSTPQPIGTSSTPTFGGMTLTGGLTGTTGAFSGIISSGGNPVPTYPRTTAENSCAATIVNLAIPAGDINRYGTNTTPGTTDMSTALQTAVNCNTSVYIPQGTYLVGGVTVPHTAGLVIHGDGNSSVLKQKGGGVSVFSWSTAAMDYSVQTIRDLQLNGTSGSNHTVNTSGEGNLTLENLYFNNTPTGFDSIFINGAGGSQTHDVRVENVQILTNLVGNAAIELGALASDIWLSGLTINGNLQLPYALYFDSGANAVRVQNSNIYNTSNSVVYGAGSNNFLMFDHDELSFSSGADVVVFNNSSDILFTNVYIDDVQAGRNGVTLNNTSGVGFINGMWLGVAGAGYTVNETGTSNFNYASGGNVTTNSVWASGIFNLIGAGSKVCSVAGVTDSQICGTTAANPTGTIGLTAVNGTAKTWMRSDASPPLSQAISPTWTGNHVFTPTSGVGVTINAQGANNALNVVGSNGQTQIDSTGDQLVFTRNGFNFITATGASATLQIQASGGSGTVILGARGSNVETIQTGVQIGAPTGGDKGAGTLNATGLFINGTAIVPSVANPSGLIGMSAVNGIATTADRSDATHAIDPAIAPTWTAQHSFSQAFTTSGTAGNYPIFAKSATPAIALDATGAAADAKVWELTPTNTDLLLRTSNDAGSTTKNVIDITRAANVVTGIAIGNTTDNPPTTLHGGLIADSAFPTIATGTSGIYLGGTSGGTSRVAMVDSAGASNSKLWDCIINTTDYLCRLGDDANSTFTTWMDVTRSGTSVTSVAFPNGTTKIADQETATGNTGSVASGSANTVLTVSGVKVYMVFCSLASSNDAANYNEVAMVTSNGTTAAIATLVNAALMAITLSGQNVQCTQSSGSNATITWHYSLYF